MRREQLDVVPILGQAVLELGHRAFAVRDLSLDSFELRRPLPRLWRGWLLLVRRLQVGRTCGRTQLLATTDVLRPAAVVRIEPLVLDGKRPLGNRVEERPVMRHE